MIYRIDNNTKIDMNSKGHERILQNGKNILSVVLGEVVLGRDIGINNNIIDSPINKGMTMISIENQFKKYEPRLKIHKVTHDTDTESGKLNYIVEVSIIE